MSQISYKNRQRSDYWFSLGVFTLVFFGLIMIYSVSKYLSLQVTNGASDKIYLMGQLVSLGIGIIVWFIFQNIDYHVWKKYSGLMLIITIAMLLVVFLFGHSGQTSAQRWISILGFHFQPSEIVKLTFIIYLAGWFSSKSEKKGAINQNFWLFAGIVGLIAFFLLQQKDLGTLSVIVGIAAGIYFAAGANLKNLALAGGLGAFLFWIAVKKEPYRMQRILAFLNPDSNNLSSGYHIRNALIAIGSGGFWGLGFGQSRQKYLYLPEAQTDSIFAIISEELGFIGAIIVVGAFTFLAIRGLKIAREAPDMFGRLLGVGIVIWIAFQAFVNIAAMLSLIPLTGVPLPFISYGGSNLVVTLAAVGILLNISRHKRYS